MMQLNYFKKLQPSMGTELISLGPRHTCMYDGTVLPPQTIHSFMFPINQSLIYLTAKTTGQSKESYSKP